MNVKEAVADAKKYIVDIFSDESPTNVGLEEVEFDTQKGEWIVTIGFSRPWNSPLNSFAAVLAATTTPQREYKVLHISDETGKVLSIKNRESQA